MPLNPLPQDRDACLATVRRDNRDASYGAGFLQANRADHGPCSVLFGDVLWALFQPATVVDFGCASGYTLWSLQRHGADVLGYDISDSAHAFAREVGGDQLASHIRAPVDLNDPPPPDEVGKHELAISIEVLEHLRPESADGIVRTICRSAPVAAITACPPVGRNPLHLNEQPFDDWIVLFAKHGMGLDVETTRAVQWFMRAIKEQGNLTVPSWHFSSYFGIFRRAVE